jgi:hypothetical protein
MPATTPTAAQPTLFVAPLEYKTGKLSAEQGSLPHRAQVMLYSLMMGDRYGRELSKVCSAYLLARICACSDSCCCC